MQVRGEKMILGAHAESGKPSGRDGQVLVTVEGVGSADINSKVIVIVFLTVYYSSLASTTNLLAHHSGLKPWQPSTFLIAD